MFNREYIDRTLNYCDQRFEEVRSDEVYKADFYSKLAELELCGWLEEMIDLLFLETVNNMLSDEAERERKLEKFNKSYVKPVFGFKSKQVDNMFVSVIGFAEYEKMKQNLGLEVQSFKTFTGELSRRRDVHAHTHSIEDRQALNAPSKTRETLDALYPVLEKFGSYMERHFVS